MIHRRSLTLTDPERQALEHLKQRLNSMWVINLTQGRCRNSTNVRFDIVQKHMN